MAQITSLSDRRSVRPPEVSTVWARRRTSVLRITIFRGGRALLKTTVPGDEILGGREAEGGEIPVRYSQDQAAGRGFADAAEARYCSGLGAGDLSMDQKKRLLDGMRGRINESVLDAMSRIPRELFVPEQLRDRAYEDTPLPIGLGQTISAPHMVAIMSDLLDVRPGMKILEVGGGSGYHAAVLAALTGPQGRVYSVERMPDLAAAARRNLQAAGIENVTVVEGDGSLGLPEHAPYDRISVAASAPKIPEPLKEQLQVGGKMVLPVGGGSQELIGEKRPVGRGRWE